MKRTCLGILLATSGYAYFAFESKLIPRMGSYLHEHMTRAAFGDYPSADVASHVLVIPKSDYPDIYKFKQYILAKDKVPSTHFDDTPGIPCYEWVQWPCEVENIEYAHYGAKSFDALGATTMTVLYWKGNEAGWRLVANEKYNRGEFKKAYAYTGYEVHLKQDATVPAHEKIVWHGPAYDYTYVSMADTSPLGVTPVSKGFIPTTRPRVDWFELAATRQLNNDLVATSRQEYFGPPAIFNREFQAVLSSEGIPSSVCSARPFWRSHAELSQLLHPDKEDRWGAYSIGLTSACAEPQTSASFDWFPVSTLDTHTLQGGATSIQSATEIARRALYVAVKETHDSLIEFSTNAPPVVTLEQRNLTADFSGVDSSVAFSLVVQENRTQNVYLSIQDTASHKYVRASVKTTSQVLENIDLDSPLRALGSDPISLQKQSDDDLTVLPWKDRWTITWDGTMADGSKIGPGPRILRIRITDRDGNTAAADLYCTVTGTPLGTKLFSLSPDGPLDFGSVAVGSSGDKSVVMQNDGGAGVAVTSLALSGGNSGQFRIQDAPATPFTIEPGKTREIKLRLSPTSAGAKSATLTVANDSTNNPSAPLTLSGSGAAIASCSYSVRTTYVSVAASAAGGEFTVSAGDGCVWSATTDQAFITITSPAGGAGKGSGPVKFSAEAFSGPVRQGTILVRGGGKLFTIVVSQDGTITAPCQYRLLSSSYSAAAAGGPANLDVVTTADCGWSVASDTPWITVSGGASRKGGDSVQLSILEYNKGTTKRFGTVSVKTSAGASLVFTVSQEPGSTACTYSLVEEQVNAAWQGGSVAVKVRTQPGCAWQVSAISTIGTWLRAQSSTAGRGNGEVTLVADRYDGHVPRAGVVSVTNEAQTLVYTVTQEGRPSDYPVIQLLQTAFSLGNVMVGSTSYQTIPVKNIGQENLLPYGLEKISGSADFSVFASLPVVYPGGSGSITIAFAPSSVGSHTAIFRLSSNDPLHPTTDFTVTATAVLQGGGGSDFAWTAVGTLPGATGVNSPVSATSVGNLVYGFGIGAANTSYAYDASGGAWTPLRNSPLGVDESSAVAIGTKVFLVGHSVDFRVQILDTQTGQWSAGAVMLTGRRGMAVAVVGGKIYAIGGTNNSVQAACEEYNPATDSWAIKPGMQTARAYSSAATVGGKIYVMGGVRADNTYVNSVEVFDPLTNTWTAAASMPYPQRRSSAVSIGGLIYLIGGEGSSNGETSLNRVLEFNPAAGPSGTWTIRNSILNPRDRPAATVVNSAVFVLGGYKWAGNVSTPVSTIERGALTLGPQMFVPNTSVAFGDTPVGSVAEAPFVLMNNGSGPLSFSTTILKNGIPVRGDTVDFSISLARGTAIPVEPGGTVRARVRFTPQSSGLVTGILRISSNDPTHSTVDVDLAGNGLSSSGLPAGNVLESKVALSLAGTGAIRKFRIAGGQAYISRDGPPRLTVLDIASGSTLAEIPFAAYPSAQPGVPALWAQRAFVPLGNLGADGRLAVVNLDTKTVEQYVPTGRISSVADSANGRIYVAGGGCYSSSGTNGGTVKVYDARTLSAISTIPTGSLTGYVSADPATGRIVATNDPCGLPDYDPGIAPRLIDSVTNTATSIDFAFSSSVSESRDGRGYILGPGLMLVVDTQTGQPVNRIAMDAGEGCCSLAASRDYVFVANGDSGRVDVISVEKGALVASATADNPGQIVADPYVNAAYVATGSPRVTLTRIAIVSPDFDVNCDGITLPILPGASGSGACRIRSSSGFSAPVTLSTNGLPAGVTAGLTPSAVTPQGNQSQAFGVTLSVSSEVLPGSYDLKVIGRNGDVIRGASLGLTVPSCSVVVPSDVRTYAASGAADSVDILATVGCAWSVVKDADWVTIQSGQTGVGPGKVSFQVSANKLALARTARVTVSGETLTITQSAASVSISADSVTPTSGAGALAAMAATFTDIAGYADIHSAYLLINTSVSAAQACFIQYQRANNVFYLFSDSGSWQGPLAAGSTASLQNNQCMLNGAGTAATGSGNTLTMTLALRFKAPFAGSRKVFLYALGNNGLNTDWQERGTWTQPRNVTADSLTLGGTGPTTTLTGAFSASTAYTDLHSVYMLINAALDPGQSCLIQYQRSGNGFYLRSDSGLWQGPLAAGGSDSYQNGQCVLYGTGSSVTGSGTSLTMTVAVAFKAAFAGAKTVYLYGLGNNGAASDWQNHGTLAAAQAAPTADTVSPPSGAGVSATFTAAFTDISGYADLHSTYLRINAGLSGNGGCYIQYSRAVNAFYLQGDSGSWQGPLTGGSSGSLQNNQCTLNGTGTSVAGSGNTLTMTASLAFKASFIGAKTVYLYGLSSLGLNTGWQPLGTWTVPAQAPTADSVTPASGSGTSATFSAAFTDPNGYAGLHSTYMQVNASFNGSSSCHVQYQQGTNALYLLDSGSWLGPLTPGSSGTLQNNQCTLSGAGSSVSGSGNTFTMTAALTFKAAFSGNKTVFLYAVENNGTISGWQPRGTWTVPAITADSVTPSSGSGGSASLAAAFTDGNGYTDVHSAYMLINATFSGAGGCFIQYQRNASAFFLLGDSGGWQGPLTPGSSGSLQNNQCVLTGTGSSVAGSGNTLIMTAALAFRAGFSGQKNIYLYGLAAAGANSGWQNKGTYTVVIQNGITADSVTPASGSGPGAAFAASFSDGNGHADVHSVYILMNSTFSGAGACFVQYQRDNSAFYLLGNSGSWLGPLAAGSPSSVQNNQCTLNGTGSSISGSGTTLTVTASLDFKAPFAGTKTVFLYGLASNGQNTGWQAKGTYNATPPVISVDSLTPAAGGGSSASLAAVFSDGSGYADVHSAYMLINGTFSGSGGCYVQYQRNTDAFYLLGDGGAWQGPLSGGSSGTLQNNQCTLNGAGTSVAGSGNTLTMTASLSFKPAFAGLKTVYLYGLANGGAVSGWQSKGKFNVTAPVTPTAPTADSVTPSSGSGSTATLAAVYSIPNGYANYHSVYLLINTAISGAQSCFIQYQRANNAFYLLGDTGAWQGPLAAGSGSLGNSQCTLQGVGTSVSGSGDSLNMTVSLAFKPAFAGAKSVFLYGLGANGSPTGWQPRGTWLVQ